MSDADYAILGSVTVRRAPDAASIQLTEQHRLLLARLLVVPNARVTTDALVEALWEDNPGVDPRNAVQVAVSKVRMLLGDVGRVKRIIVTDSSTYRLVVADPLRIDAERFRRLATRGHDLVADRPRAARAMLVEAQSTWRGPLFGELGERAWAIGHARELDSMRDRVEIDLNEVRLALNEHADLEGPLRRQIEQHPHDERRRAHLVRALDGAGRTAEAQLAYRQAFRDLGAVGPELQRAGEDVARRPPRVAASERLPSPPALASVGRPDSIMLCAVLDPRGRCGADPGLGLLSLLVDRHGGDSHPLADDLLVAIFADAQAALRAGAAIAGDSRLRPRIGVHAGGIVRFGNGVAGPGPARCRQLAVLAHPGQVLVSAAARALIDSSIELLDLGEQRFFDLGAGEVVFELATPGGEHFPPPETLDQLSHNLPVQPTRFVGRAAELARLSPLVAGGRLITLVGPGGCGKTRLALQLAAMHIQAFADGAWLAQLAELSVGSEEEDVAATIAYQLGVRSLPEEAPSDALLRHLTDRAALLVIDNCEHVPRPCAALVSRLLVTCRDVCIVATTRRALRIDGEHVLAVASMAIGEVDRRGLPSDAVQLLLERSGGLPRDVPASQDTLALAARICRAVDGLPLAIELAAGQVPTRGLEGVAVEVEAMMRGERRLYELASDDPRRPERQRTIESTIDWSYQLLTEREQRALQRLAVFHGTFGIREAQCLNELGDADTGSIASLVDCSMVAAAAPLHGASRLRLVEPIRTFALDLLKASGGLDTAREAHAEIFRELAIATAPLLFGPQEQVSLQQLEADHNNLCAALGWYVERGCGRASLRMIGALWWLWFSHGHLEEGCTWVQRALAIGEEPSQERVRALRAGSHLSWWRGDDAQSDAHNRALEACAEAIEDDWGRAWVPMAFGAARMFRDPTGSLPLFEESKLRFDALGLRWEAGYALQLIGGARWFAGDERSAGVAYEEAVEIFAALGHRSVLASVQRGAGLMAARCGRPGRGVVLCEDALRRSDAIEDRAGSAQALNFLAAISRDAQDLTTAVTRYAEALRLAREVGDLWATCWALDGLASAARVYGDAEIAAQLLATSGRLADRSHYLQPPREREQRDADLAALRLELDESELERASAEGAVLGIGDAVACALAFAARHA